MTQIIGVRFKPVGKIYYFDPLDYNLKVGDNVIVETSRGTEYGKVVLDKREIPESSIKKPIKNVTRPATDEDKRRNAENHEKEKKAFEICVDKIKKHKLNMKLVEVEYTFDSNKIMFYFTADGRVDFRDLVKDLATVFHTRIELRQIGVRDESKTVGSVGMCGRGICCHEFLGEFMPVSIKMAKEQGLSLNPTKISGVCGRLMCCLKYEQDNYDELLKVTPRQGSLVQTPSGKGTVESVNILRGTVRVKIESKSETTIKEYGVKDLKVLKNARSDDDKISDKELEKLQ